MKKVLLASHGMLASGLKNTLEIFVGETNSIIDVCAYNEPGDDYLKEIQKFIDDADLEDAVIFTDIYGGSVNQQVTSMVMKSKKLIPIVTSMSLPLVLSIILSVEPVTKESVDRLANECAPIFVELQIETEEDDNDDFFS